MSDLPGSSPDAIRAPEPSHATTHEAPDPARLTQITSGIHFEPNPANQRFTRMQSEVGNLIPYIAQRIAQSNLSSSELPEYLQGLNTVYQSLYRDFYGITSNMKQLVENCRTLDDMRQLQEMLATYSGEFPTQHFQRDIGILLPEIFERIPAQEDRQAVLSTEMLLYHAREPQIDRDIQKFEEYKQGLEEQLLRTNADEFVDVEDYDNPGQTIRIAKVDLLRGQLDSLTPPEYRYAEVTNLFTQAPSLNYFFETADTMLQLQQITGTFPYTMGVSYLSQDVGIYSHDYETFQLLNRNILTAAGLPESFVHVLLHPGNIFNKERNGVGNFVLQALQQEVTPLNLNRLLEQLRHVPGSSSERHNQNRLDAISVEGTGLGNLKEMIHDQVEGIHTLVTAVVTYATTHDDASRAVIIEFMQTYPELKNDTAALFNDETYAKTTNTGESTLEVLQRVVKNTAPAALQEKPPVTGVGELDQLLKAAEKGTESDLAAALHAINEHLLQLQSRHQQGLEPNIIVAIAWLDHKSFELMKTYVDGDRTTDNLTQLYSAYKQPWYAESIKLLLLTSTPTSLPPEELTTFIDTLTSQPNPTAATKVLSERLGDLTKALGQIYRAEGKTDEEIDALWSGNIMDGLNMLGSSYPPTEDSWDATLRLTRGKEAIASTAQAKDEATVTLQTSLEGLTDLPEGATFTDIQSGESDLIDSMYHIYAALKNRTLEQAIGEVTSTYRDSWQMGSILRALGLENTYIRYNNEQTPLLSMSGNVNGNTIEAVLYDGVIPIGSARVNGTVVRTRDELIAALHLPAVYRSLSREGD